RRCETRAAENRPPVRRAGCVPAAGNRPEIELPVHGCLIPMGELHPCKCRAVFSSSHRRTSLQVVLPSDRKLAIDTYHLVAILKPSALTCKRANHERRKTMTGTLADDYALGRSEGEIQRLIAQGSRL